MNYEFKMMDCPEHGLTEHVEQNSGYVCEKCMGDDFAANEKENIEIIGNMNLNNISP